MLTYYDCHKSLNIKLPKFTQLKIGSPDWGGLRKRELAFGDDYSTMTVHPNAVQGMKVKVENSVGTYTFKEVGLEQPIVEVTDLLDPVDVDVEEAIEVIEVS